MNKTIVVIFLLFIALKTSSGLTYAETIGIPSTQQNITTSGADASYSNNGNILKDLNKPTGLFFSNKIILPESRIDHRLTDDNNTETTFGFIGINRSMTSETRQAIEATGTIILDYMPYNNFIAKIPLAGIQGLSKLPFVTWITKLSPEQKILDYRLQEITNDSTTSDAIIVLFEDDSNGKTRQKIIDLGADITAYNKELNYFLIKASNEQLAKISGFDEVMFINKPATSLIGTLSEAGPATGTDYTHTESYSSTGPFNGTGMTLAMIDLAAYANHTDLPNYATCERFPSGSCDTTGDISRHATMAACAAFGRGTASNGAYTGAAPGITNVSIAQPSISTIADALIWTGNLGVDIVMDNVHANYSGPPYYTGCRGTEPESAAADLIVFSNKTIFVPSIGNSGSNSNTTLAPGCAKNAITVGEILDYGNSTTDDISTESSRGPTADNRRKPDVVVPSEYLTSCSNTNSSSYYTDRGTSYAAPQVAGIIATMIEHYPGWYRHNASAIKAKIMASSILPDGIYDIPNSYGSGKLDAFLAQWDTNDANGWSSIQLYDGNVTPTTYRYWDITVPSGVKKMKVALAWSEQKAALFAGSALRNDIELYVDMGANDTGCSGEWWSATGYDNKEYTYIDNPPAGTYRIKACPYSLADPYQIVSGAVFFIQGNPQPDIRLTLTPNTTQLRPGNRISIIGKEEAAGYVVSGTFVDMTIPTGVDFANLTLPLRDGRTIKLATKSLNVGDVIYNLPRNQTWELQMTQAGNKTLLLYANPSNKNGTINSTSVTITVNTPPVFWSNCTNLTIQQDSSGSGVSIDLWACSSDVEDANSAMSYSLVSQSNSSLINCFVSSNRNVTCDNPAAGQYGYNDITVRIVDTLTGWNTTVVRVNVTKLNSLQLTKGWNYVSFPNLPANTAMENVLNSVNSSWLKASHYNATKGKWNTTDQRVTPSFRQLTNFTIGEAYWVYATENATLQLTGTKPASFVKNLTVGWNSFAWPYSSKSIAEALAPIAGNYIKIQAYNATTTKWTTYDVRVPSSFNTITNLTPQAGYWILVNQSTQGTFST